MTTAPSPVRRGVLIVLALAVAAVYVVSRTNPPPTVNMVWEGDSQSAVGGGLVSTADATVHLVKEKSIRVATFAKGGSKVADLVQRAGGVDHRFVDKKNTANVLVVWAGANDLGAGTSVDKTKAKLVAYLTARRQVGWSIVLLTATPRTFPTDKPGYETRRQQLNALLRTDWRAYANVFVDVAADPRIGAPGAQADATYFLPDHTHLNSAGREVVAGLVAPALAPVGVR